MLLLILVPLVLISADFIRSKNLFDNSFIEIRNKATFVDKTPLIYEFLQHKYLFINAPSKFGKSTNIDMLSLFLGNHRSKQTIETYFIWTKIWEGEDFVRNNLGEYPVVHFKLNIHGYSADFDTYLTAFKVSVYNSFIDHMYLTESEKLSEDQRALLEIYSDLTKYKNMDNEKLARGLQFLAEILFLHHGKSIILLADEFGKGITERILQNNDDLESIVELYTSVLHNTFHNESIISHALLSSETWLHGVQIPVVDLFERVEFMQTVELSRFYGFTYDELEQLMLKFNIVKKEKSEITKWFCGYSSLDGLFKVCNPFSILQYLSEKKEIIYWTGSALGPDVARRMIEVESLHKSVINNLCWRRPVVLEISNKTNMVDIMFMAKNINKTPENCRNFFLRILLESGYLTCDDNQPQSGNISLKFPNEEVRFSIMRLTEI